MRPATGASQPQPVTVRPPARGGARPAKVAAAGPLIPAHRPSPPPGTWSRKERDRGTPKPAHHSGPQRPPKAGSRLGHSATHGTGRVVSRPEQVVPRWRAPRLATGAEARPPPRGTWPTGRVRTGPSGQRPTTWRQLLQPPRRSQGRPSVRMQAQRGAGGAGFVTSARRRKGSFARLSKDRRVGGVATGASWGRDRKGRGLALTLQWLTWSPCLRKTGVGRNFLWS